MKRHSLRSAIAGLVLALVWFGTTALQAQARGGTSFAVGTASFQKGDFDAASDAFGDAIKTDPNNAEYHLWLGNAHAQTAIHSGMVTKMRLAPRMRDEWVRAAALDPRSYEAHENLYQFYRQAPGFMGGSADKAATESAEMMRINPYGAGLELASADINVKRYAGAETRLRSLLSAYPDSVAVPSTLALIQQNAQHFDDAWSTLDQAHARFPHDIQIAYLIGRGAALSGNRLDVGQATLEDIIAVPDKVGKLDIVRQGGAHYRLGKILERKGDRAGARIQYETALKISPNDPGAKQALEHLRVQ